jgi:aldose 1-epimerase
MGDFERLSAVKVASIPYTLTNANGMQAAVSDYGGIVLSLTAPDRQGRFADVVLGHASVEQYVQSTSYFGALIGRYANRIAQGHFTLDGQSYQLSRNDGPHHLHGGHRGFDKVQWTTERHTPQQLVLHYTSPHNEEGYPGTLRVQVKISLTDANELRFDYHATTDQATTVNLTHHSYFNLAGDGAGDVLDHLVMINADAFTPVHPDLIPTGEIRQVAGTAFDFRTPTALGARMDADDEQLRFGSGYDHNFVLNAAPGESTLAARVLEPNSGRVLEVFTTQPGLQLYTGNYLAGTGPGKSGEHYRKHSGFALEAQHFPDSPNQAHFPCTVLRPGAEYRARTVYRFTTSKS